MEVDKKRKEDKIFYAEYKDKFVEAGLWKKIGILAKNLSIVSNFYDFRIYDKHARNIISILFVYVKKNESNISGDHPYFYNSQNINIKKKHLRIKM